jgi:hypothetical protein
MQETCHAIDHNFRQSPTFDATTGTPHAMASRADGPKLSCNDGNRNRSRDRQQAHDILSFTDQLDLAADAQLADQLFRADPVPGLRRQSAAARHARSNPREHAHDRVDLLDWTQIGEMNHQPFARFAIAGAQRRIQPAAIDIEIDEIRNDRDVARDRHRALRVRAQARRHRGHGVGLIDAKRHGLPVRRI